jgi:hypothetical protein
MLKAAIGNGFDGQEGGFDCGLGSIEGVLHVVRIRVNVHLALLETLVPHVLHKLEVALPVDITD